MTFFCAMLTSFLHNTGASCILKWTFTIKKEVTKTIKKWNYEKDEMTKKTMNSNWIIVITNVFFVRPGGKTGNGSLPSASKDGLRGTLLVFFLFLLNDGIVKSILQYITLHIVLLSWFWKCLFQLKHTIHVQ